MTNFNDIHLQFSIQHSGLKNVKVWLKMFSGWKKTQQKQLSRHCEEHHYTYSNYNQEPWNHNIFIGALHKAELKDILSWHSEGDPWEQSSLTWKLSNVLTVFPVHSFVLKSEEALASLCTTGCAGTWGAPASSCKDDAVLQEDLPFFWVRSALYSKCSCLRCFHSFFNLTRLKFLCTFKRLTFLFSPLHVSLKVSNFHRFCHYMYCAFSI